MVNNKKNKNKAPQKMEIEISRYKTLIEALGDPKRVVRLMILLMATVIILVLGIISVIYGIKRFYPYKSINSNDYGATFIKDEDNEIIYWLFNTADLWANSGIVVKEGDIISVHTSGAFNPSIHHVVKDANDNIKLRDPWVLSGGKGRLEYGQLYSQEVARDKFRIAPYAPFSVILMQVMPNDIVDNLDRGWLRNPLLAPYVDGYADWVYPWNKDEDKAKKKKEEKKFVVPDIYVIGPGKESIRIRKDGVLHFAVNDIALTYENIVRMEQSKETKDKFKKVKGVWYFVPKELFVSTFNTKALDSIIGFSNWFVTDTSLKKNSGDTLIMSTEFWNRDNLRQMGIMYDSIHFDPTYLNKEDPKIPDIPKAYAKNTENYLKLLQDSLWIDRFWPPMENDYYKDREFVDAWFVDNVGSFMIVIERKTDK